MIGSERTSSSSAVPWPWLRGRAALVAAAGLVCVVCLGAGGVVALGLAGRAGSSPPLTSIVPAAPAVDSGGPAQQDAAGSAAGAAPAAGAAAPAAGPARGGQAGTTALPGGVVVPTSCGTAPAVQFRGRGLAVTGVAPVATSAPQVTTLTATLQEHGTDAASVVEMAQARVDAVVAALQQAGLPASAVHRSSFSSYGDVLGRSFTAYATVQAELTGTEQVARASRAVLEVGGVSGYSTSSGLTAMPSPEEVQAAVAAATTQARDTALAVARAAGVRLGDLQALATQPPSICYGSGGPTRVVQVTASYAIL